MCKCLRSNLEKLVDDNPSYKGKNKLTKAIRIRIVSAVRCAIRMRSKESDQRKAAIQLEKDIRNSIHHIFGKHERCSDFCKVKTRGNLTVDESHNSNDMTEEHDGPSDVCGETALLWKEGSSLKEQENSRYASSLLYNDLHASMLQDISVLLDRVASKSARLIQNTTTNLAECWMHMRTNFDGGKLYNLCNRVSWHTRCFGGCLRMNLGPQWSPTVWRKATRSSPGHHFLNLYRQKDAHLSHSNASKKKPMASIQRWKRKMSSIKDSSAKSAMDVEPDLSKDDLTSKISSYLTLHINISDEKIHAIEALTADQSLSQVWHEERKKRITASMFGSVIKRNPSIPVTKLVQQMIYNKFKGTSLTRNGLQQERNTIHEYVLKKAEEGTNLEVKRTGFVINSNFKFLGGSPDGIVFENGIKSGVIEVKNVLYNKNFNLNEAAKQNKSFFLQFQGKKLTLKKTHNYFFQCQGLLHITNLPWIDLVVRTMNPYQIHIERIFKDISLWNSWLPKLKAFFNLVLLPELSCPRQGKVPGIREPGLWFEGKGSKRCRNNKACSSINSSDKKAECKSHSSNVPSKQTNKRRKAFHTTRFVGRRISHEWKVSENSTQWFTGTVLSLVSGTDGSDDAVYEIIYDNDNETYEVDHLVLDYKETSVIFLDL